MKKYNFRALLAASRYSISEKLRLVDEFYAGRFDEVFVFAAAPSLKDFNFERATQRLSESPVFCIKQSYSLVNQHADSLLMNFCNFTDWDWEEVGCSVLWAVFEEGQREKIKKTAKYTDIIDIRKNNRPLAESAAGRGAWEELMSIDNGFASWGPGLMYELALPLAARLRPRVINLAGWDIADQSILHADSSSEKKQNVHFYQDDNILIRAGISKDEALLVSDSIGRIGLFLKERYQCEIRIMSRTSLACESLARDYSLLE